MTTHEHWRAKLDDLNKDDRLRVDCEDGDIAIQYIGHYKGLEKRVLGDGTKRWFVKLVDEINGKNIQKWVPTNEITGIKIVKRAKG